MNGRVNPRPATSPVCHCTRHHTTPTEHTQKILKFYQISKLSFKFVVSSTRSNRHLVCEKTPTAFWQYTLSVVLWFLPSEPNSRTLNSSSVNYALQFSTCLIRTIFFGAKFKFRISCFLHFNLIWKLICWNTTIRVFANKNEKKEKKNDHEIIKLIG